MAEVFVAYQNAVGDGDGRTWDVRICGREAKDGLWDGWIEFDPVDGGETVRSRRETRQPNRADLAYWATGVTVAYLEGALERATHPLPERAPAAVESPEYDGPAPSPQPVPDSGRGRAPERGGEGAPVEGTRAAASHAVLDPFEVYAQGEQVLHDELGALNEDHLRNIIRAHALVGDDDIDLHAMTRRGLSELILAAVRKGSG